MTSKVPAMTTKKKKKPGKVVLFSQDEISEMVAEFKFKFKREVARRGKSLYAPLVEELITRTSKALRETLGT